MNGYKIVLLKAIFMLYRLPESERVCSGICMGGKSKLGMDSGLWGSSIGGGYEINTFDSMKRFDFGIGLGIGFEILQSWNIGMNYDLGFVPVVDGGGKHRALLLSVGYKF
jgi:hypothetical protein